MVGKMRQTGKVNIMPMFKREVSVAKNTIGHREVFRANKKHV